ncbi:DNA repair exonuclease [Thiomonas sp.]|uniref:metallophosphoesterase family protein n=1 Tax=Thiomonas sp. TaxID=2047785 RepID=UPI0026264577|nr:DNA repair exonuclease [Thiomonas sp.]
MRFLHAADIHLDSPLTGLSAYPDAPTELLRTATRDAFDNLVSLALDEAVDFLVIAGDLYDGSWKDFNTGIYFARQMGRLKAAGIPVFVLHGNHDAESEMTRRLSLPDNVHVFPASRAGSFELPGLQVALHGRSFKNAATTEDLVPGYPAPRQGWFNIGVLHTALEGYAAHASYAPCSMAELHAKGYQYWALGHVHEHQLWQGDSTIAFPGNLQGRNIRETGAKGALLVTADDGEVTSVERVFVDVLRWHRLAVDVSAASTLPEASRLVGGALEALLAAQTDSLPMAVRVSLTGRCAAHGELFGLEAQLRAEVLAQAAAIAAERMWIEKVVIETQPPETAQALAARADAVADLQAILETAPGDDALVAALESDFAELLARLPLEVSQGAALVESVRAGLVPELVRATVPSLLARIASAE